MDAKVGLKETDQMGIDFYEQHAIPYQVNRSNASMNMQISY